MNPGTNMWNMMATLSFDDPVSYECIQAALQEIIRRERSLSLRIIVTDGVPCQYYADDPIPVEFISFRNCGGEAGYLEWVQRERLVPLDMMNGGTLTRLVIVETAPSRYTIFSNIHHIILDGTSQAILMSRIERMVREISKGNPPPVFPTPHFPDFTIHEENYLSSPEYESDRRFWQKKLENLPEPLNFASCHADNIDRKTLIFNISPEICKEVYSYCNSVRTSPFRVFLTSFALYCSRLTGNEEIVLGTALANRYPEEMKDAIGMFVANPPLFLRCDPGQTFHELLISVTSVLKESQAHSRYPYDTLISDIRNITGETYNLLDYTFVQNVHADVGHAARARYHPPAESGSNLVLFCHTGGKGEEIPLEIYVEYNPALFSPARIERMIGHLEKIVHEGCRGSERKISNLDLLTDEEKNQLVHECNNTGHTYPDGCLQHLIHERAVRQPDNIALVYQNTRYTYGEIDRISTILAEKLVVHGAGRDQFVAILADRSAIPVIAQVAIMKAGAAFMPIDPAYPPDRIRYLIKDSECRIILATPRFIALLTENAIDIPVMLDLSNPDTFTGPEPAYVARGSSSDLAVLIYTSGSTGDPKGVMLEHRSFVNYVYWLIEEFSITDTDHVAKHASFSFDLSMLEIYPTLIAGATLYVISEEIRFSLKHLNEYFEENKISIVGFTTQFGEQFMEFVDNSSIRCLMVGGEKLRQFKKRSYTLFNFYGPTECTVSATSFRVEHDYDNIPIGYPHYNYQVYILDRWNNLQPLGASGELCIAGVSLSRGYLNLPEKTATVFIENPFIPGERLYKTGDLACWTEEGYILHLGRMDRQVKIRGFRIEIGEIEKAIMDIPGITETAVIDLKDEHGRVFLCGYYVRSRPVEEKEIREILHKTLPEFMIPAFIIALDSIPKNQNGKIDRKNLPRPEQVAEETKFVSPDTEEEKQIARIFEEVLGVHQAGALDDFFSVGGDSIKAILVIAQIESAFSCDLPFREFFRLKTPRAISTVLAGSKKPQLPGIHPAPQASSYPLSEPQKQLFMLEQMGSIKNTYIIPLVIEISGSLDKKRLADAITRLVNRHDLFRTIFALENGEPVQIVEPESKVRLSYDEVPYERSGGVIASFFTGFDLGKAPLCKVKLIQCSQDRFLLLLNLHHIIADGMSVSLLLDELSRLYAGEEIKPPAFQFRDYAVWLRNLEESGLLKGNDRFWKEYLDEYRPAELITDAERPDTPDFSGKTREFILDEQLTSSLHDLIRKTGTTLHSLLTGVIGLLYATYTQQEDVIIGTTTNGRGPEGSESVVGMFVETIPVRCRVSRDQPMISYLQQVGDNLFDLYDHQPFSLSRVYEAVAENRGAGRHPFIDLNLVVQNMEDRSFTAEGLTSTHRFFEQNLVKFDISIFVWEREHHIFFKVDYRSPLFSDDTIRYLELHLLSLIRSIVSDPSGNCGDYDLIDDEERHFLLEEVNNTRTPLPVWTTIGDAVTRISAEYPENRAIVAPDGILTYKELDLLSGRIAEQLSRHLAGCDGREETIVGIVGERSFLTVAAMVGALKAHVAYVVIDAGYPEERIRYILEDTRAQVLLGREETLRSFSGLYTGVQIPLDRLEDRSGYFALPSCTPSVHDLAYLIYTSGSTGKPKGVMVEHHSMVNFISWYTRQHQFGPGSRSLEFASFSFDVSVVQVFAPLVAGGELHVIPESLRMSPHELDQYCEENRITHAHFPTQFAEQFIQVTGNKSLNRLVVGGDRLKKYRIGTYQLVNEYGPTETTMASTSIEIDSVILNPPIGYPIANTRIYVLGLGGDLLPVGIPGELYIAGEGVSRGYLNRPDLTAEKFLSDPFVPGERMYRTGDRVRIRADGVLEYIGRIDFQVKIRGYRIEPGEIESAMRSLPGVRNTVVLAFDDASGGKFLCGFYEADSPVLESEMKAFLRGKIPEYMIPARFVHEETFPLNRNGKVDRHALKCPDFRPESCEISYEPPRNNAEHLVSKAWEKVLGRSCISIFDDFFDLGADSLRAIALVIELEKNFTVSITDIFKFRTIAEQAEHIPQSETRMSDRIPKLLDLLRQPGKVPDLAREETEYEERIRRFEWDMADFPAKRGYRRILLTGVTGTLGGYLLRDLLEMTDYTIVLIVRAHDEADAWSRVEKRIDETFGPDLLRQKRSRITILSGDLSREWCGLDEKTWQDLASTIDAVIHSAALTKHIGDYQD
ncbi:MAG: amino acid adenylation domain-containing protein, partial [Methanospirillum sp.]|nr:amino acid adenylation domain-containing protein [Methanospirillum sp.]